MDDPTRLPWVLELDDPIAFIRDIRNWQAEQREKYGDNWRDFVPPGEYNRSRGLGPHIDEIQK